MAILRILVPLSEHPSGIVTYDGDVTAIVDDAQTLYVQQGTLILAEFPQARYESWELTGDAAPPPASEG